MTTKSNTELALYGGTPVRNPTQPWPSWPRPPEEADEVLHNVLHSGRWAITSARGHSELWERRFAAKFAKYVGSKYCVPVDHGSSALLVALDALGYDYGDRVAVPALTWTASATAVFRAGLVPVLVDVSRETGCIDAETLGAVDVPQAVIAVHWASCMADVPALLEALAGSGAAVIEDCAQAHGAKWGTRSAGSLGTMGCFSMQNYKILTAGEGGAVVTDREDLVDRLEELRADSRKYDSSITTDPLKLELVESASMMGSNFCMTEFSAALLYHQLDKLDMEHAIRNANLTLLAEMLAGSPGLRVLTGHTAQTQVSVYKATMIFETDVDNREVARALTSELNLTVAPVENPLDRNRLLQPWTRPSLRALTKDFVKINADREFSNSEYLATHAVQFHHSALLGDAGDVADIAEAIGKVRTAFDL